MANEQYPSDDAIRSELEPVVAKLYDRHVALVAKKGHEGWHPHEMQDWDKASNFAMRGGTVWTPEQYAKLHDGEFDIDDATRSSIIIGYSTEDNISKYVLALAMSFGGKGQWGKWNRRWTAEEERHSDVIRDFCIATRAVDPGLLEDMRFENISAEDDMLFNKAPLNGAAYVSFQERATRVAHDGTAARLHQDDVGKEVFTRVSNDENRHMLFYRDLTKAALALWPDATMRAITDEMRGFQMPGFMTIPNFFDHAVNIADAGIYDLHRQNEEVFADTLRDWGIDKLSLSGEADRARDELKQVMQEKEQAADMFDDFLAKRKRNRKSS